MTVFGFEESGKWFDVEGGGRIQLQSMTADKHKEIRRKTVKKKTDFKKVEGTPARFEYEEVNDDLANELFWDFVIVDWENFFDAKGETIICNKENKLMMIAKSTKFMKIVSECLKELNDAEAEAAAAAAKN